MPGKGRPSHRIDITGQADAMRFLLSVGSVGQRRIESCRAMRIDLESRRGRTNRDIIPASAWASLVDPSIHDMGLTTRDARRLLRPSYGPSATSRTNMSRERAHAVAEIVGSPELAALATSDVYWDEVTLVEPDGDEEVFDLTVEGLHNFVADDIVLHNSIEQDADLVFFVYRDEYYNGEESDQQGLAEVILSKHRNGPTDSLKLSFLKRYAKFTDLAG